MSYINYSINKLKSITRDMWGENPEVIFTKVRGIYDTNTNRHGGFLVDINLHPELKDYGSKTEHKDIRAFEEDYEALKVLWLFPELIRSKENIDEWLNKDTVVRYEDNKKFIEEFPERRIEKEYIDTPSRKGEIPPWIVKENSSLSDIELLKKEIYQETKTPFVDPFLLHELQKRELIKPGEKTEQLRKRLDRLVEKVWEGLEDIPFYEKESVQYIDEDYFEFKKGTEKEEIWHWFDENHSKGIHFLLYEYEINKTEESEEEEDLEQ